MMKMKMTGSSLALLTHSLFKALVVCVYSHLLVPFCALTEESEPNLTPCITLLSKEAGKSENVEIVSKFRVF